jgi:hypothetical protein
MQARYPNTPIFGYGGQVNPSRKEADEGMTAKQSGQELDKKRDVTVTGQGKLKVEINGPPGVRATASGEGLLKDTQIEQRVQMAPASVGPPEGLAVLTTRRPAPVRVQSPIR